MKLLDFLINCRDHIARRRKFKRREALQFKVDVLSAKIEVQREKLGILQRDNYLLYFSNVNKQTLLLSLIGQNEGKLKGYTRILDTMNKEML
jgi:hypothetical protein